VIGNRDMTKKYIPVDNVSVCSYTVPCHVGVPECMTAVY
jgi:hypothetical protein